jgi:serine/threonine protein kinase
MIQPAITQVGRYKILGVIGEGGMGIVYRAVDPNMARDVAIKMPHGDKELLEQFQREVRATASFQHKNIVTIHTVDEFEGFPYMVMEYLDGQSMAEAISSGRALTLHDKLSLAIQVCDGLQYAHELGFIHRDIKPANVYILKDRFKDRDLVAKILDFGIARATVDSSITRTGQVRGSVSYMSPEQISGKKVDSRTDIYSTGVLLFQFIAGEVPYKSSDPNATFLKILNDPVPSLTAYVKDCPAALEEIVRRAMAKDLDERYQTAEEFGYELSRLLETIKRGMTQEFLEQAKAAALRRDLDLARQHLLEILKLDRHHAQANELLQAVRQELQKEQKFIQVQQLRSQAQIAFSGLQYEEALECLDQACQIAPDDRDLSSFRESIKDAAKRAKSLEEALRRGQAALYVGDLQEAEAAVDEALQCATDHTEACALKELIKKELDERSRRQQVKVFVEQARQEISKSQFIEA